jgi:predicted CxxxxCH...CXXCH cytochrome family protein
MELKMKYFLLNFILVLSVIILFNGCSKLQDNITQPPQLTIHSKGVNDATSVDFHGNQLKANNFSLDQCKQCHAADFSGGITKVACNSCHNYPHNAGITDTTSTAFHGLLIKANNYNLDQCSKCHGTDFSGAGSDKLNCKTCHTQASGPLACNTCHGVFSDPSLIAPPRDLNGNISTDSINVGAHVSHLYSNSLSVVACENCHIVPTASNVKDHLNQGVHQIVIFNNLAINNVSISPVFNPGAGTCSNTYCHGNFQFNKSDAPSERQFAFTADKMTGNNKTVKWTDLGGTQAPCGSCHGTSDGFISPEGHIKVSRNQCVACHSTVVDENGNIIDKTKHLNGQINFAKSK